MSAWSREIERIVDQRDMTLPPTWRRRHGHPVVPLGAQGLLRSDPSREAARALCNCVARAREVVVVASFLLADAGIEEALLAAAQRGVRVYLLLAAEARLEKDPREDESFDKAVIEQHKQMLQRLAGWVFVRSAESFHAKVVLVDPRGSSPAGWLLTANLTREALERNEELAVRLTPAEVRAAFERLRWAFWEGVQHELREPGIFRPAKPLGRVALPGADAAIVATTGETGTLRERLLTEIRAAQRWIFVSSFGWSASHPVVTALCERAAAGVTVVVLARVRPAAMPALLALSSSGARVFGFTWLHAKALLVDGRRGLVMSANLEPHGLDTGFELGVAMHDERAAALGQMLASWVEAAPYELAVAPRLRDVQGESLLWLGEKLVPYDVQPRREQLCPSVMAPSAEQLEGIELPAPTPIEPPAPCHELRLAGRVDAPRLDKKAELIPPTKGAQSVDGGPAVYREKSGRVVVAVSAPEQLPAARSLAEEVRADAIVVRD